MLANLTSILIAILALQSVISLLLLYAWKVVGFIEEDPLELMNYRDDDDAAFNFGIFLIIAFAFPYYVVATTVNWVCKKLGKNYKEQPEANENNNSDE